jgi:hypothetical protein
MSLAAGAGALPLSAEIGRTVLSRQFFGGYSGIIGGFHPALRAVRIPRSCPSTVTSCPSRKTCSLSATETLSDSAAGLGT